MNYKELSEEEFISRAEKQIEALNQALDKVDEKNVRMHICWGNYEGPHTPVSYTHLTLPTKA